MSWLSRLTNTLNPRRLDNDLAEEMRDHIERRAADLQAKGLSASEAQRKAALTFGSVTGLWEQSRELRLLGTLEATLQDIRYAWRGILKNPALAVTVVVSLGLAIGANTAIYSILDAALLRPLPVPRPDQLFTLSSTGDGQSGMPAAGGDDAFSYLLYEQLRASAGDSARLVLLGSPNRVEARAAEEDAPYEDVIQQLVSPDSFEVLGVSPVLGRLLSAAEVHYPGPRAVVVLSYDYWQRRFGGSDAVLGKTLSVDGRKYFILGVAREGYTGTEPGKFVDVWLPTTVTDPSIFTNPDIRLFHLMGRLAPGVSRQRIGAVLQSTFHEHQKTRIGLGTGIPPAIQKRRLEQSLLVYSGANGISDFRRTYSRPLWILLGISAAILLIACANVASLLLARSTARSAEMALRISLGARRARLVRQLLTESLLISLLAGLCGWALAAIAAPALVRSVSSETNPVQLDVALNLHVLLFCGGICAVSALFFGVLPAWQATAQRPIAGLHHAGGLHGRLRMGRVFVGLQVAIAFCLVAGGSGFILSLRHLAAVNAGFDRNGLTVLTITNTSQPNRQLPLLHEMQMRTAALPQVKEAATAWMAILSGARRAQRVGLPGKELSEREETFYRVSPGYFAALRTPLLSGRDFTFNDNDNEPVPTIVNRAFARRYFNTDSVLGREFRRDDGARHQIVALAADSHFGDLRGGPEPIVYMPMKPPRAFTLYVRSTLDAASVAKIVESEARKLDREVGVRDVTTMTVIMGRTVVREKLLAGIGGTFALLGLILAAVGLFGLLNYSVTLRTKEIGIRTALGAPRLPIYRLVLKDLMSVIIVGMAVGLGGSLALQGLTQSLLFGIRPADPMVIAAAMAVFLSAAILACWLPARRAASIDPLVALRHE
jgi:predicted permease